MPNSNYKYFVGVDPSFRGMGISIIDTENKKLKFKELSVEVGKGTFAEISKASEEMVDLFLTENKEIISVTTRLGMEIPPVTGMYAVKLWALDTHLYNNLIMSDNWLFNVPYLKFINKKYDGKKDTKEMMTKIIELFKDYGYEVTTNLKSKNGKDRKLTSNQLDSFIYAIRMFVKTYMEYGIHDDLITEIIELNDRFLEEKETKLGKKF